MSPGPWCPPIHGAPMGMCGRTQGSETRASPSRAPLWVFQPKDDRSMPNCDGVLERRRNGDEGRLAACGYARRCAPDSSGRWGFSQGGLRRTSGSARRRADSYSGRPVAVLLRDGGRQANLSMFQVEDITAQHEVLGAPPTRGLLSPADFIDVPEGSTPRCRPTSCAARDGNAGRTATSRDRPPYPSRIATRTAI